jgi:hypothetical protein
MSEIDWRKILVAYMDFVEDDEGTISIGLPDWTTRSVIDKDLSASLTKDERDALFSLHDSAERHAGRMRK